MDDLLGKALEGALASGPIAVVLFFVLSKLWGAYLQAQSDLKELQNKLLKILENATHDEDDHGK